MATTSSPPPPPQQDDGTKTTDHQEPEPPTPEPPHSETLESPHPLNPEAGDQEPPNPPPPNEEKDTISAPEEDQPPRRETDYRSGTTPEPPSEPAAVAGETDPPPLASPVNPHRRPGKRKKGAGRHLQKLKKSMERVKTLTGILNPIPFEPRKTLDFDKHEEILRRLGLWEFSKIEFDRSIRADLLTQLIATYDPKRKCSYVNDFRINVNRAVLARALKLPKQEKGSGGGGVEEVDLDSEVFSDEAIGFIEDFVSSWLLLHDGNRPGPPEVANMTRCIKDGHPEKLDSATLIWFLVEKELAKGDTLTDCRYASHLQHLIRSQREEVFSMEMEVEEAKEEDYGTVGAGVDVAGDDDGVAGDGSVKVGEEEEKEEKANDSLVQECNLQLNLGADAAAEEDSTMVEEAAEEDSTMVEADERNDNPGWPVGDHFLQRCQGDDLHSFQPEKPDFEPEKPDEADDEQVEEDEPEPVERVENGPHGYDMEANNDSMDPDGLTGNFLQGMETSHIPFGSQPDLDLFGPRDGSFMAHGGPSSFFSNGSKRPLEHEEIDHHRHHPLDPNNKRLKTEEPTDLGQCFDQMQHWMEKAKMMYESEEQSQRHLQFNQQFANSQLQERQELMETVIKTKNEELQKKHTEVFRLERELYLMGDLVAGYRKALNDTRARFAEYRKQHALREEPLYQDAGPGGLVLSVRELEKQRVKLEEDRARFIGLCRDLEQQWDLEFEAHSGRVLAMADKLVCVEGEVRRVKELWAQRAEAEEGRKSGDGVAEDNGSVLLSEAGVAESQEE